MTKELFSVKASNLGPIIEAEVALRPLTIFIGPNNSGKSYLAMLIYGLLHSASPQSWRRWTLRHYPFVPLPAKTPQRFKKWWEQFVEQAMTGESKETQISIKDLPEEISRYLFGQVRSAMEEFARELSSEVRRCYGAALDKCYGEDEFLRSEEVAAYLFVIQSLYEEAVLRS